MSSDTWYGFECVECGMVLDLRREGPFREGAPTPACPDCLKTHGASDTMRFKGSWAADASGYGSRGDAGG